MEANPNVLQNSLPIIRQFERKSKNHNQLFPYAIHVNKPPTAKEDEWILYIIYISENLYSMKANPNTLQNSLPNIRHFDDGCSGEKKNTGRVQLLKSIVQTKQNTRSRKKKRSPNTFSSVYPRKQAHEVSCLPWEKTLHPNRSSSLELLQWTLSMVYPRPSGHPFSPVGAHFFPTFWGENNKRLGKLGEIY